MSAGKGNKHGGRKTRIKSKFYQNSKHRREAVKAKKERKKS
jgi:hypothetical protein